MNMRERIAAYDATTKLPHNKLANLRRRVDRVRNFPHNTCGASRHVHIMADSLLRYGDYPMFREEPAHCAASLLSVLESLWSARTAANLPVGGK